MKRLIKKGGLAIVGGIVWFLFALFGIPSLIGWIYEKQFGTEQVYLLTGDLTGVPILLSLVLFGIFVWLFSPNGAFGNLLRGEEGFKAKFSDRTKGIIFGCSTLVAVLGMAASVFWIDCFTTEGIKSFRFGQEKEYVWEDAEYVTLKDDFDGVLMYEMVMKDGKTYHFNGGILRVMEYYSNAFDEEFPRDVDDYAVWLSRELKEKQVPLQVKDWNKLEKKLKYDSWRKLAEEIRAVYEE